MCWTGQRSCKNVSIKCGLFKSIRFLRWFFFSIYLVHDELKDKNFELELSWVCKESKGLHEKVPEHIFLEAEKAAKQAMEADSESDTEEI